MIVSARLLIEGAKLNISEVVKNNRSDFREFYAELEQGLQSRLTKRLESMAENGQSVNETKFKHEKDKIYAIKLN
ncbi:MAG: hypothetical protein HQK58_09150 [Deltaproteobacteria bacterium]|nr:hypothetical protein [Deltaproteobacteria bacterium]